MRKLVFEIAINFLSQGVKLGSLKMAVAVLSLPNMIFGVCGMQGGMPGLFVVKKMRLRAAPYAWVPRSLLFLR